MRIRASLASLWLAVAWAILPVRPGDAVAAIGLPTSGDRAALQTVGLRTQGTTDMSELRRLMWARIHRAHSAHRVPARIPPPHGPCRAYGSVLIPGSRWLSGRGVDVFSNGGIGANCFSLEAGHRWQCGELVNRLLAIRGWSPGIAGYAGQFYDNADPALFDRHPIGSGYLPVVGDIVVWSGGVPAPGVPQGYGHAAVVAVDAGGALTVVEQNSTISGYGAIAIDPTGAIGPVGGLAPVGYLHAKANPLAPPASPAPAPKPSPTVPTHHQQPPPPSGAPSGPTPTPTPMPTPVPTPEPIPTPTPVPIPMPTPTESATATAPATPTATATP